MSSYCIYLRKSRADVEAEARGEGDTLRRHRETLLALAKAHDLRVEKIFEEVVSGDTIAARPQIQEMLAEIEAELWSGVLVMEIERLARGDTVDQGIIAQTFKYSNAQIITPNKTYDPNSEADEEYFEFGLFMARREYKTIKRRLQAGRVASVREGLYCGSRDIYGYHRHKREDGKGYTLEIVPEEAEIVRSIFGWYTSGIDGRSVGAGMIADKLNSMGVRTDHGHLWTDTRVLKVLKNPTYSGAVQWNKRQQVTRMVDGRKSVRRIRGKPIIVKGIQTPIISQELFDKAQFYIAGRRKAPLAPDRKTANPLAGLVKCGLCGRAMVRQINSINPAYDLLKCSSAHCETKATYVTTVERSVLATLVSWQRDYGVFKPTGIVPDATIEAARAKQQAIIRTLKEQLGSLHDLLEQHVYDIPTFLDRQKDINRRMAEAEAILAGISISPTLNREEAIRAILPKAADVLASYDMALSPADRNELLKSVIDHITYNKPERRYKNESEAEHLTLEVYPAVPRTE